MAQEIMSVPEPTIRILILLPKAVSLESLLRQLPSEYSKNGSVYFTDDPEEPVDIVVVMHISAIQQTVKLYSHKAARIFVSMEPSGLLVNASSRFYSQFDLVYAVSKIAGAREQVYENIHTWWCGLDVRVEKNAHHFGAVSKRGYDYYQSRRFNKTKKISCIVSNKLFSDGHLKRRRFLHKLLNSPYAAEIDFYGESFTPVECKDDALVDYQYTIVLENDTVEGYWSEKLADALLCECIPIYWGAPDIDAFFPENRFLTFNVDSWSSFEKAFKLALLNLDLSSRVNSVLDAKKLVLNKYNFSLILLDSAKAWASKKRGIYKKEYLIAPKKFSIYFFYAFGRRVYWALLKLRYQLFLYRFKLVGK